MSEPERIHDRYRIQRQLSRTPSAITWLVTDERDDQTCVIKEVSLAESATLKLVELFEREAAALRRLDHKRIPNYIDFFSVSSTDDIRLYLVQEYIEGKTLRQWMEEGRRFTEDESIGIAIQVAEVLVYLHGLQPHIIHRDIKPSNILLDPQGQVHLIDFGAVTATDRAADGSLPNAMTLVGTYGYMAYEQTLGQPLPASDVYSLAASLVHLLSRRDPSMMLTPEHGIEFRDHVNLSDNLIAVLETCLQPDASQRYENGAALLQDLRRLQAGEAPKGIQKKSWLPAFILITVLFMATASSGAWAWNHFHPARVHSFDPGSGVNRALSPSYHTTIDGFSMYVDALDFNVQGNLLAAKSGDEIQILETGTWKKKATLQICSKESGFSPLSDVMFCGDSLLAAGYQHWDKEDESYADARIVLWSTSTWEQCDDVVLSPGKLQSLDLKLHSKELLVSLSDYDMEWSKNVNGMIYIINPQSSSIIHQLEMPEGAAIYDAKFYLSDNGDEIACLCGGEGKKDRVIRFYSYPELQPLRECVVPDGVESMTFASGNVVLQCMSDEIMYVYDISSNTMILQPNRGLQSIGSSYRSFTEHAFSLWGFVAVPESRKVGSKNLRFISLYYYDTWEFAGWMESSSSIKNHFIRSMKFGVAGKYFAAGMGNDFKGEIKIWELDDLRKQLRLK